MWHVTKGNDEINSVLRLSYHNLPSNLKRCFVYCSIFPKGYEFDKDELIKLWMAEGLLKCCGRHKSEQELGNEFLDDLESISFFQQSEPIFGHIGLCMHDLVNDLAKSESQKFCLQIEGDRVQDISERTRHIWCSLGLEDGARILKHIYMFKGLCSLFVRRRALFDNRFMMSNNVQRDLFSKLRYLRMLSICGCELTELADEIVNLKLLRYLDLTYSKIERLTNSICKMYNLETLILEGCSELTVLPSDFYKLVSLRHLNTRGSGIKKMPKKIGRLNHLQTLTNFAVGEKNGSDIKELDSLNHLQGGLCISGLERVINPADAAEANLKDKKHLKELYMNYGDSLKINNNGRELDVFEALQPNSNLQRLTINYYNGSSFPNWLRGCHLPNLVSLKLRCGFISLFPPLGQLPCLKELFISDCNGVKIIGEEFYGDCSTLVPFRSLEFLVFEKMPEWKEWFCLEGFPLLRELSIYRCPKLKRFHPQNLLSLQSLNIDECEQLEVSISKVDNIRILNLRKCYRIFVNELPSSLERFILNKNRYIEFSVEQNLLDNDILEDLELDFSGSVECPSLDLRCYNSLRILYLKGWHSSSLPFPLHLFTNLDSLKLKDCPELESFPEGGLPSNLRKLKIYNCPKLIASREDWGLFKLNSLKRFIVRDDFKTVESFPEESLLPSTLHTLFLDNCSKLRIMNYKGLLHLKSLKVLHIENCPSLERLPEEGIPNSLSRLVISYCPLLEQQYQKEGGNRWHTIRQIPDITIFTT